MSRTIDIRPHIISDKSRAPSPTLTPSQNRPTNLNLHDNNKLQRHPRQYMTLIRTVLKTSTRSITSGISMHRVPAAMVKRPIANMAVHAPRDPNTLSNYVSWRTQHITANLEIDFAKKRLFGDVVLRMKSLEGESGEIVLDSR
jgi:hypothetical protein